MHAVDTNVLVRLIMNDNAKQNETATAIFAEYQVWIAKTVLLETEWVLRRVYGFNSLAVQTAFSSVVGLPNVSVEDRTSVMNALDLVAAGLDFADAFHLASRPTGAAFVTFDQALVRRAKRAQVASVSAPN